MISLMNRKQLDTLYTANNVRKSDSVTKATAFILPTYKRCVCHPKCHHINHYTEENDYASKNTDDQE